LSEPILRVDQLVVRYPTRKRRQYFLASDHVSFEVGKGETLGLVGESGSGKSTIGRAILGLAPIYEGTIEFDGGDITRLPFTARRRLSNSLQVVFQDPYGSLNPTKSVGQTLIEPIFVHKGSSRATARARVGEVLDLVGLPRSVQGKFPREFSGGQRQRIAIARALMMQPKLIICDEPVSALDLSIQAQIINLFADLQRETGVSYLFISHDLAVVRHLASRVVVLNKGQIVETGTTAEIYSNPQQPYTQRLLASVPALVGVSS
jgi:ABC-type oligopeptide transport system ATPase subunit